MADFWLHVASSAVVYNTTSPISLTSNPSAALTPLAEQYPYSIHLNQTLCDAHTSLNGGICLTGESVGFAWYTPSIAKSGILIASNSTPTKGLFGPSEPYPQHPVSVITLADENDLAVIVPTTVDPTLSWTGPTFGVRSTCKNLTPQCKTDNVTSNSQPIYDCTPAGFPSVSYTHL